MLQTPAKEYTAIRNDRGMRGGVEPAAGRRRIGAEQTSSRQERREKRRPLNIGTGIAEVLETSALEQAAGGVEIGHRIMADAGPVTVRGNQYGGESERGPGIGKCTAVSARLGSWHRGESV